MSGSGFNPIGETAIGQLQDERVANAAFAVATQSSDADTVYLIQMLGYRSSTDATGWVAPIGTTGIGELAANDTASANMTLYFSDRDWVSDPADATLPNVWFEGRASEPLAMDRELPLDPTSARRVAVNVGTIELLNHDGRLDDVLDQVSFVGRPISVRYGRRSDAYADFGVVFSGVVSAPPVADGNTVRITVRDKTFGLEASFLGTYGGTGGTDGDAEILGQVKRRAYGPAQNVTLRCIVKASLVYQGHDGAIQGVDAVRDSGATLSLDTTVGTAGDVADYATLIAATIVAGKYITCLALGLIRLASTPAGAITADLRGGKISGVYVTAMSDIAKGILTVDGQVDPSLVDQGAFATLVGTAPGAITICFDAQGTVADAVTQVIAKVPQCWWGNTRAGQITVGRLLAPSNEGRHFDTGNIVGPVQLLDLPPTVSPTLWRVTPAYKPNYTVQSAADLVASATPAKVQLYGQPYVTGTPSVDSGRLTRDPIAPEMLLVTGYDQATDAQAAAADTFNFYAPGRKPVGVPMKAVIHLMDLNQPVTLTYPRYGLSSGRNAVVVGIREQASQRGGVLKVFG